MTADGGFRTGDRGRLDRDGFLFIDEITTFLQGKFGGYEIPRKLVYLSDNFTVDNGTLTQTMKLKRRVVLEQQKDQIEALYA